MLALAASVALYAAPARAQVTAEAWLDRHMLEAARDRALPRGAIPLLRVRHLREQLDPTPLAARLHAFAIAPGLPPLRRALAIFLEAETRRDLGQTTEADGLIRSLGFITRWSVVGPFDNEGRNGFHTARAPEADRGAVPDPARELEGRERPVRWRVMPNLSVLGQVPLDAVVRPSVNACAYAHTTVTSSLAGPAVLWLGATGSVAAWVNGREVLRDEAVRKAFPDRAGAAVTLLRGANRVLVKVCTDDRGLGFYARFTRPDGTPRADVTVDDDPSHAPAQRPVVAAATAPTMQGVLTALRPADMAHATDAAREDYARYLSLTGSEDLAHPEAADLAEGIAQHAPSVDHWLLFAELTRDRNRRLAALQSAETLRHDDPHVLLAMGHERRVGVHAEEAIPYLERLMTREPRYLAPRVEYALVLDGLGLSLSALRSLDEAARQSPRSPILTRVRMQLAEHAQQWDEVQRLRASLKAVRASDLDVLEGDAREARAQGDHDAVVRTVERMLALRPDVLSVYTLSADLLEGVGEGPRAGAVLSQATDLATDEPSLWTARAELSARLGLADDARAAMRRALALRPQDASLRQHLEAMEPAVARADEAHADTSEVILARRGHGDESAAYNVRVLQELTVRTVYENGLSDTFRQVAYEVQNDQGARDGRSWNMQYDPSAQRFELRMAKVHHRDGSADEGAQVGEYSLTSDPSMRMYFSNRVVQVAFDHLRVGDVVELRWRVDDVSARNAFADYFGDFQIVQGDVPRAHYEYVLRAPSSREFFVHAAPIAEGRTLRAETRHDGNTTVRLWEADDVPAIPPEDRAPGLTERAAYLHVSTYRAWEDVGRWYWGLVRDQLVADDRMRETVRTVTRGLPDDRAKVRAIYNWVTSHTHYVALEFGIHGFKPYPVTQVCTRGFGDCKDKASVIVAMLREAGIDASMVLVRTRRNGNIESLPASLAVFDHAIAYVPSLDLFLDGTAENSGMDELPSGDQGVMVLIVDQRGTARLARTPVYTADRNVTRATSDVTLDANGGATIHVVEDQRGPDAAGMRRSLEAQATRAERVEDDLRGIYPGAHVTAVTTGDLHNVDAPAHLDYTATVPAFGTRQGTQWLIHGASPLDLTRRYGTRSTRVHDLVVGVPSTLDENRTLHLPPGVTVAESPPPVHLDSPYGRFDYTVEAQANVLHVHRALVLSRDRVAAAEYAAFRAFCQSVDDALSRRVALRAPEVAR